MTQRHPIQNELPLLITSVTHERKPFFRNPTFAEEAVEHVYRVQERNPFILYGFVIMPDHCHFLLRVPAPETISNIMRIYKMGLSFQIGIAPLWQKRFHARLAEDILSVKKYIHANPVIAGITETTDDYEWSSASGKWEVTDIGVL